MLITLYGINNIGKTTQTKRLVEALKARGYDAVRVKYPVYDVKPSGVYLNEVLRLGGAQKISEEELQLWFVLNRYQFQPTLKSWLDAGRIVVAEDYVGTGIAWGTAKGADMEWLEQMNRDLLKEDLAILMEGQRHTRAIEEGHLHEENTALIERCRTVHSTLADRYGWQRIQVQPSIEGTFGLLWELVESKLPSKQQ